MTYDDKFYRRNPLMVRAFHFGHEFPPDWFDDLMAAGKVSTLIGTNRIGIATPNGKVYAEWGDYVVKVETVGIWTVEQEAFAALYTSADTATEHLLWPDMRIAEELGKIVAHNEQGNLPRRYDDELLYRMRDDYEEVANRLRAARSSDFLAMLEESERETMRGDPSRTLHSVINDQNHYADQIRKLREEVDRLTAENEQLKLAQSPHARMAAKMKAKHPQLTQGTQDENTSQQDRVD